MKNIAKAAASGGAAVWTLGIEQLPEHETFRFRALVPLEVCALVIHCHPHLSSTSSFTIYLVQFYHPPHPVLPSTSSNFYHPSLLCCVCLADICVCGQHARLRDTDEEIPAFELQHITKAEKVPFI